MCSQGRLGWPRTSVFVSTIAKNGPSFTFAQVPKNQELSSFPGNFLFVEESNCYKQEKLFTPNCRVSQFRQDFHFEVFSGSK